MPSLEEEPTVSLMLLKRIVLAVYHPGEGPSCAHAHADKNMSDAHMRTTYENMSDAQMRKRAPCCQLGVPAGRGR